MTLPLPVFDDPAHEQYHSTRPPSPGPLDNHDTPLDEARWDGWVIRGRRADAASREKLRMLVVVGVTVGVGAGTIWMFLG